MLALSHETWNTFWPEALPLLQAHRLETAPDDRRPFEVQISTARTLCEAQVLHIWTARSNGVLVGYIGWYVAPGLDSPVLTATQGPWYVQPAWRGLTGFKLFERSLAGLKALDVKVCFPHHWLSGNGPDLAKYFSRKGAKPLEVSYELWLEE